MAIAHPTADLCDKYHTHDVDATVEEPALRILPPIFRDYGGARTFAGPAHTIKCFENNPLVRKAVLGPGRGRVLVVDGGGSLRCALLGDMLGNIAAKNGWSGIIVNGCIRDAEGLGALPELGVKALATCPLKSSKRDPGVEGAPVVIGGCVIRPGDYVYADADGVIVSREELSLP
ncbi:hypothetical protein Rsub_03970 [Raphidocelis subcapitata]|uniref:4-hydroxy-4-methyl-2-oxoglutarate aldolase n=1 Tax=Raphidocelis subcapitata TaxID=307507 RepID=A0A2V0NVL2_9CHLO|nr:hypothetical protein Rsub_03970 [Raphidocelis subcapitata]|eukprot:GBF91666.1 hypothetical protein Rsub_03970 [Raphidocelis subcapitata]